MTRPGRPTTLEADAHIHIRVDQNTKNALVILASNWQCTPSEAVRRAIKQCAGWDANQK